MLSRMIKYRKYNSIQGHFIRYPCFIDTFGVFIVKEVVEERFVRQGYPMLTSMLWLPQNFLPYKTIIAENLTMSVFFHTSKY